MKNHICKYKESPLASKKSFIDDGPLVMAFVQMAFFCSFEAIFGFVAYFVYIRESQAYSRWLRNDKSLKEFDGQWCKHLWPRPMF